MSIKEGLQVIYARHTICAPIKLQQAMAKSIQWLTHVVKRPWADGNDFAGSGLPALGQQYFHASTHSVAACNHSTLHYTAEQVAALLIYNFMSDTNNKLGPHHQIRNRLLNIPVPMADEMSHT